MLKVHARKSFSPNHLKSTEQCDTFLWYIITAKNKLKWIHQQAHKKYWTLWLIIKSHKWSSIFVFSHCSWIWKHRQHFGQDIGWASWPWSNYLKIHIHALGTKDWEAFKASLRINFTKWWQWQVWKKGCYKPPGYGSPLCLKNRITKCMKRFLSNPSQETHILLFAWIFG